MWKAWRAWLWDSSTGRPVRPWKTLAYMLFSFCMRMRGFFCNFPFDSLMDLLGGKLTRVCYFPYWLVFTWSFVSQACQTKPTFSHSSSFSHCSSLLLLPYISDLPSLDYLHLSVSLSDYQDTRVPCELISPAALTGVIDLSKCLAF